MFEEIEGIFKCNRGEYDCVYLVEYSVYEEHDSFTAHNELGSLTNYDYVEEHIEIEDIAAQVYYNEDGDETMLVRDVKLTDELKRYLIKEIQR